MKNIRKNLLKNLKYTSAQISIYYESYNIKKLVEYSSKSLELLYNIIEQDNIDLSNEENRVFNNLILILNGLKKDGLNINKNNNSFNGIVNIKDIYDIDNFLMDQFIELLKKWNINFDDYLDIKYNELEEYLSYGNQEYWFAIDRDISDYASILKDNNQNELAEFLDNLFFNGKDYMDDNIAIAIMDNIEYYKKGELKKIDLDYSSKIL